jgi:hypothetical protein
LCCCSLSSKLPNHKMLTPSTSIGNPRAVNSRYSLAMKWYDGTNEAQPRRTPSSATPVRTLSYSKNHIRQRKDNLIVFGHQLRVQKKLRSSRFALRVEIPVPKKTLVVPVGCPLRSSDQFDGSPLRTTLQTRHPT